MLRSSAADWEERRGRADESASRICHDENRRKPRKSHTRNFFDVFPAEGGRYVTQLLGLALFNL
jgi:hypothetical protein